MIRKVKLEDAAAIASIYKHYVEHTTVSFETVAPSASVMTERISNISCSHPYLVYEEDGNVLGYCYAHPWKERAAYGFTWETTIYLSPSIQGKGIGRELGSRLIKECRESGAHALIACITSENEASIRFHQSLGFSVVSHFKQVGWKFGRWLDVTDLELLL